MPKVITKCEHCGKSFSCNCSPARKKQRYCSRECQKLAARLWTDCPECGKHFWYHKSWPRKYCSRPCSAANNAKKNLGIVELPPMYCEQCGKEITTGKRSNSRFCNMECSGKWQSEHKTGENHPSYNKVERQCRNCNKEFKTSPCEVEKGWGNFCSRSCAAQWQQLNAENPPRPPVLCGEDNARYKGGYFPYYGPSWRPQRRLARERDNYTCQRCGVTEIELGRELDVHHIKPFREFAIDHFDKANHLDNLVCLCNSCHTLAENYGLND